LDFETLKSDLKDIVKDSVNDYDFANIQEHCQNNTEYIINLQNYGYNVPVSCDIVVLGQDEVKGFVIDKIIEKEYYKKYTCSFLNCPSEEKDPFVYLSFHAKDYWTKWLYYSVIASLILLVLMFLVAENRKSLFIDVGGLLIVSSLPLLFLNWLVNNFAFVDILFSKSKTVFMIVLITGITLIVFGIGLKFWKFKSEDKTISKDDIKKLVKQERINQLEESIKNRRKEIETSKNRKKK
jgi:hypothetical protein